jgi:hypothetical protein
MTPVALRETIERDGVGFDRFREDVRAEMLVARLRDREVDSRNAWWATVRFSRSCAPGESGRENRRVQLDAYLVTFLNRRHR